MTNALLKERVLDWLKTETNITAAIATTDGTTPDAAVIYYHINDDYTLYFLTATHTVKHRYLTQNPQISIAVGFGPAYTTVQGTGTALPISARSEEEQHAIALIKKRLQDNNCHWPVFQLERYAGEQMVVYKFTPTSLRLLNLDPDNNLPVTTEDFVEVL